MTDVLSVAIAPCGFRRDHIGLLIAPGSATAHTESVTSDVALQFATSMLRRFASTGTQRVSATTG